MNFNRVTLVSLVTLFFASSTLESATIPPMMIEQLEQHYAENGYPDNHPLKHQIQGALYAEINGTRLYKGAECRATIAGTMQKYTDKVLGKPKIRYYNSADQLISTYQFSYSVPLTPKIFDTIRAQLTELPIVDTVDVVSFKAPNWQSIEMYDANGHCIVKTNLNYWGGLKENDLLTPEVIKECSPFVSNVKTLNICRIRAAYSINLFTGLRHRVKNCN